MATATFRKSSADAPDGFFAVEAAGLRWLASSGAVAVPEVVAVDRTGITLERVAEAPPTRASAQQLGRSPGRDAPIRCAAPRRPAGRLAR